jgi:hypothetical protein
VRKALAVDDAVGDSMPQRIEHTRRQWPSVPTPVIEVRPAGPRRRGGETVTASVQCHYCSALDGKHGAEFRVGDHWATWRRTASTS